MFCKDLSDIILTRRRRQIESCVETDTSQINGDSSQDFSICRFSGLNQEESVFILLSCGEFSAGLILRLLYTSCDFYLACQVCVISRIFSRKRKFLAVLVSDEIRRQCRADRNFHEAEI